MMAIKPVPAAVCSITASSFGNVCAGELKSMINGIGIETSGGNPATDLLPFNDRYESFRPRSTDVLIYSRP